LGYRENFSIYDQSDQIALIKETARELKLAPEALSLYKTAELFSAVKTGRRTWTGGEELLFPLYEEYLSHLKVYNAVDFDDLLVLPLRIFREHPSVLEEYRSRFRYIMVDEFQDTSMIQYDFMKLLADGSRNICVVGDDDQSIYSWRGANFENILRFEKDYPERVELKLEQNYRSTDTILAAANGLISHNKNRKNKELWTPSSGGRPIEIFYPEDEKKEAEFIAGTLRGLKFRENLKFSDVGVLLRTNHLTAPIEEAFLAENIPYRVSGGQPFFQRQEIKDIIAYLRLMANPDDDVSLLRIINTPRRGIGKKTVEHINLAAKTNSCSLFSAVHLLAGGGDLSLGEKTKLELAGFLELMEEHRSLAMRPRHIAQAVRSLVNAVGYWEYLVAEFPQNKNAAKWKFKNIDSFCSSIEYWEKDPENMNPGLYNYLNRISLQSQDEDADEDEKGKVNLMTIHSAKGLEFEVVFLPAVEEGIIPLARTLEESEDSLEEERRLFYVAITRARSKLLITSCRRRRMMKEVIDSSPSPFITEIPPALIVRHTEEAPPSAEKTADFFAALKQKLASGVEAQ
jgi:DNA helicase-2/ATP-dependent DNA helicase PcrA